MLSRIGRRIGASPYLLLAIAPLCWAGNHIVGRLIAEDVAPGSLSLLRWIVSAAVVLPFAFGHLRRDAPKLAEAPWTVTLLAIAGGGVFGTLQFVALKYTIALNAAVFNATVPAFIIAAGAVIFRDRVRLVQVLGILISLCGVLVIVGKGDPQVFEHLQFNGGDVIIVANMALFAVYSACLRLRPGAHWMTFLIAMSVVSALTNVPLTIAEAMTGEPLKFDLMTLLAVGYAGVITSALAYAAWARGIELIGAARAGAFLYLVPVYGAILSTLLLGEQIHAFHLAGLGLILTGVTLASRK
jgi:drug/metabolite transporter (DMT)-like permease